MIWELQKYFDLGLICPVFWGNILLNTLSEILLIKRYLDFRFWQCELFTNLFKHQELFCLLVSNNLMVVYSYTWSELSRRWERPLKISRAQTLCRLFLTSAMPYITISVQLLSSVQSLSCVRLFATPWITAHQASLSITISWSSLRLTSTESMMLSSHLILGRPLLLLPPIPPSIRVFSNESTLPMKWPKYWSFSFSIIPSKETPGLISFRMDWLDLLAVQGTLKSLLQHHSSKASILRRSAFFHSPTLTSIHDHRKNHSLD